MFAEEDLNEDAPLMSLFQSRRGSSKRRTCNTKSPSNSLKQAEQSPESHQNPTSNRHTVAGRKHIRIILDDDDDDDDDEMGCLKIKDHHGLLDDATIGGEGEYDH